MNIRPQHIILDEEYVPTAAAAASAEPFAKPDHKSKGHSKPRRNEKVGGGFFVFGRGRRTGRIKTGAILAGRMPFEHPSEESAITEAERLHGLTGRRFDVFALRVSVGDGYEPGDVLFGGDAP
jgi:hypothetical protein